MPGVERQGAQGTEPPPPSPAAGMGVSTVTATRILKGQLHHNPGEETRLEMDKFPYVALSKVSPAPHVQASHLLAWLQQGRVGEPSLQARRSALLGSLWAPL